MEKVDINRYNKGQDKYKTELDGYHLWVQEIKTEKWGVVNHNDFLLKPKYGWREMFDNDSDYQKEYKDWIWSKYAGVSFYLFEGDWTRRQPQLHTGYILEFMQERMK